MLSDILQVKMNMSYISTQRHPQQYKHSIISHIITKYTYKEATVNSSSEWHQLTACCDAKYDDKFGSAVKEGTPL